MQYVQFGTAGVRVSRMALGMGLRGQSDEAEVERLIQTAFDRGINLFDCANVYGPMDDRAFAGRSEEILGRALRAHRDDVVITSKVAGGSANGIQLQRAIVNSSLSSSASSPTITRLAFASSSIT